MPRSLRASEPDLVACFLRGRTMSAKVGDNFSAPRSVHEGSPQGAYLEITSFVPPQMNSTLFLQLKPHLWNRPSQKKLLKIFKKRELLLTRPMKNMTQTMTMRTDLTSGFSVRSGQGRSSKTPRCPSDAPKPRNATKTRPTPTS